MKIVKLRKSAKIPTRGSEQAAGYDLYAATDGEYIGNNQFKYLTAISLEIPKGYVGLIAPRSSIYKTNLRQANQPGVIDSDYRGEIAFIFDYIGGEFYGDPTVYKKGDRIGQIIFVKHAQAKFQEVKSLIKTKRGKGGFGSTGR